MFGRDLQEAREWCKKYSISSNDADLNAAWELYVAVFLDTCYVTYLGAGTVMCFVESRSK